MPFARLVVSLLLLGCQSLPDKPDDVPYHTLYTVIDDPEARQFLEAGLSWLQAEYGPTEFEIKDVLLLRSRKNAAGSAYRIAEGFSLTEIVDADAGVFAIYIAVPPDHEVFYPLLAHEIGHLKQPSLVDDWEMEGFCMVFSRELCLRQNKDWTIWERRMLKHPRDPYSRAYRDTLNAER